VGRVFNTVAAQRQNRYSAFMTKERAIANRIVQAWFGAMNPPLGGRHPSQFPRDANDDKAVFRAARVKTTISHRFNSITNYYTDHPTDCQLHQPPPQRSVPFIVVERPTGSRANQENKGYENRGEVRRREPNLEPFFGGCHSCRKIQKLSMNEAAKNSWAR
jgi:hypothetical protein